MKRKYSLKNKSRFSMVLVLTLLVGFTLVFTSTAYGEDKDIEKNIIEVRAGDTLWSLAESFKGDNDIREYIYDIKASNNLKSSEIKAGMELIMP